MDAEISSESSELIAISELTNVRFVTNNDKLIRYCFSNKGLIKTMEQICNRLGLSHIVTVRYITGDDPLVFTEYGFDWTCHEDLVSIGYASPEQNKKAES